MGRRRALSSMPPRGLLPPRWIAQPQQSVTMSTCDSTYATRRVLRYRVVVFGQCVASDVEHPFGHTVHPFGHTVHPVAECSQHPFGHTVHGIHRHCVVCCFLLPSMPQIQSLSRLFPVSSWIFSCHRWRFDLRCALCGSVCFATHVSPSCIYLCELRRTPQIYVF